MPCAHNIIISTFIFHLHFTHACNIVVLIWHTNKVRVYILNKFKSFDIIRHTDFMYIYTYTVYVEPRNTSDERKLQPPMRVVTTLRRSETEEKATVQHSCVYTDGAYYLLCRWVICHPSIWATIRAARHVPYRWATRPTRPDIIAVLVFFFTCVSNLFKHSSQFSQVRSFAQEFCLLSTSFFISRFIIIDFNMLAGCVFLYCCIVSLMTLSLSCLMSMYRRGFRLTDKTSGQQRMWRATPHTISCLWMSDSSKPPVVLYIQLNRIYTQCGTYPVEFQINSRSVR